MYKFANSILAKIYDFYGTVLELKKVHPTLKAYTSKDFEIRAKNLHLYSIKCANNVRIMGLKNFQWLWTYKQKYKVVSK